MTKNGICTLSERARIQKQQYLEKANNDNESIKDLCEDFISYANKKASYSDWNPNNNKNNKFKNPTILDPASDENNIEENGIT